MTKLEKTGVFCWYWGAKLAQSVLVFAGSMYLLGGVDAVIAYLFSGVITALLFKETL